VKSRRRYVGAPLIAERERTVAVAKRQTNPDLAELLQMSKELRLLIDVSIFYYLLCFAVLCRNDALIHGKGPNIDTLSIINCSIYDLDITANNPVESAKSTLHATSMKAHIIK